MTTSSGAAKRQSVLSRLGALESLTERMEDTVNRATENVSFASPSGTASRRKLSDAMGGICSTTLTKRASKPLAVMNTAADNGGRVAAQPLPDASTLDLYVDAVRRSVMQDVEQTRQQCDAETERAEARVAAMRADLEVLQSRRDAADDEIARRRRELEVLRREVEAAQDAVAEAKDAADRAKMDERAIQKKIESVALAKRDIEERTVKLEDRIDEIEAREVDVARRERQLDATIRPLQQQAERAEEMMAAYRLREAKFKDEEKAMAERAANLAKESERASVATRQAEALQETLSHDRRSVDERLEEISEREARLARETAALMEERHRLHGEREGLVADTRRNRDAMEAEAHELAAARHSAEQILSALTEEINQHKALLHNERTLVVEARRERLRLEDEVQRVIAGRDDELRRTQEDVEDSRAAFHEALAELSAVEREVERARAVARDINEEVEAARESWGRQLEEERAQLQLAMEHGEQELAARAEEQVAHQSASDAKMAAEAERLATEARQLEAIAMALTHREEEMGRKLEELSSLEMDVKGKQTEVMNADLAVEERMGELKVKAAKLVAHEDSLQAWKDEVKSAAMAQIASREETLRQWEEGLRRKEEAICDTERELATQRKLSDEAREKNEAELQRKLEDLEGQLAAALEEKKRVESLEKELSASKAALMDDSHVLNERKEHLDGHERLLVAKEKELLTIKEEVEVRNAETARMVRTLESRESAASEAEAAVAEEQAALLEREKKCADLEAMSADISHREAEADRKQAAAEATLAAAGEWEERRVIEERRLNELSDAVLKEVERVEFEKKDILAAKESLQALETALDARERSLNDAWTTLKTDVETSRSHAALGNLATAAATEMAMESADAMPREQGLPPQPLSKEDVALGAFHFSPPSVTGLMTHEGNTGVGSGGGAAAVSEIVRKRAALVSREGALQRWAASLQVESDRIAATASRLAESEREIARERAALDSEKKCITGNAEKLSRDLETATAQRAEVDRLMAEARRVEADNVAKEAEIESMREEMLALRGIIEKEQRNAEERTREAGTMLAELEGREASLHEREMAAAAGLKQLEGIGARSEEADRKQADAEKSALEVAEMRAAAEEEFLKRQADIDNERKDWLREREEAEARYARIELQSQEMALKEAALEEARIELETSRDASRVLIEEAELARSRLGVIQSTEQNMDHRLGDLVRRENALLERQRSLESQQARIDREHADLMERVRYVTATEEAVAHSKRSLEEMVARVRNDNDECFVLRSDLQRRDEALTEREEKLRRQMEDLRREESEASERRKLVSINSSQGREQEPSIQRKLLYDEEEKQRQQDMYLNLKAIEMKETELKQKEEEFTLMEKQNEDMLTTAQKHYEDADKEIKARETELDALRKGLEQWQESLAEKAEETAEVARTLFERNKTIESKIEKINSTEKETLSRKQQLEEMESQLATRETMVNELGRTMHEAGRLLQAHAAEEVGDILKRKAKIEREELEVMLSARKRAADGIGRSPTSNTSRRVVDRSIDGASARSGYADSESRKLAQNFHTLVDTGASSHRTPSGTGGALTGSSLASVGDDAPGGSGGSVASGVGADLHAKFEELQETARKLKRRQQQISQAEARASSMQRLVEERREHVEEYAKSLESRERSLRESELLVQQKMDEESPRNEAVDVKIQSILKKLRDELEAKHEFQNLTPDAENTSSNGEESG